MAIGLLTVTVGHGTAAAFNSTRLPCTAISVQAASGNSAAVYIGDSNTLASTSTGIYIPAPATNVPAAPIQFSQFNGGNPINLAEWFADSGSASQKLIVLYQIT